MTGSHQSLNASVLERPVLTRTLLTALRASLRSRDSQYRVEQELRRRTEVELSLNAANEELQAFSYSVFHDLRTPHFFECTFTTIFKDLCSNAFAFRSHYAGPNVISTHHIPV